MFTFLILFCVYMSVIQCFTPNCVRENQFRNYGFPVEACSENFKERCRFHPKGYFKSVGDVWLVKIGETTVIPTCAFVNTDILRCIYGANRKIEVLATGAFMNLPNLESIHLEFNHIKEVRNDVFKNISVEFLDLSWNKIAFIDSYAFKEVSNLKFLNLSRNSLMTLSINHLAKTLITLNLAHNLLETFALNSDSFFNLTTVDVSDNKINKVAISCKYPTETLDLTGNRIQDFSYMEINSVKQFKMGKNLFERVPQYVENINAQEIDIYPNPWKCEELFLLWETLVSFNIHLAPKENGKDAPAECSEASFRPVATRSIECLSDHECAPYMTCRAKKCWDPCEESSCHNSNVCETKNHVFKCSCSTGLVADPLDIHAECKNVECFTNTHCQFPKSCWDEKCISVDAPAFAYAPAPTPPPRPIHDITTPFIFNPSQPFNAFIPPTISSPPLDQDTEAPELPWWFDDIPSFTPASKNATLKI